MEKYKPSKHEWGKPASTRLAKKITPNEKVKMESFESFICEISQSTKDRYLRRATGDATMANFAKRSTSGKEQEYWARKEKNRKKGIARALPKRNYTAESSKPKPIASVSSTSGSNTHYIHHWDNGEITSHGGRSKTSLALSNHAFNHRGGTKAAAKAVTDVVKSAKNSDDLANKLNSSRLGSTNWKPVK